MIKSDYSVLVVDDEESQRLILTGHLRKRGFTAASAPSAIAAIEILKDSVVDVVISDYKMPEMTGLQFLSEVKSINPEINFIIITAFGTVENAVTAMKKGAYDFISKPVNLDELDLLLDRLIERQLLISEVKHLREQLSVKKNLQGVISSSQKMIEILDVASRVSESKASVLICGDSGTGKEVLARAIHSASLRFDKPFIAVNCAALNENLIESELFGHEKGAFTGADKQRKGRFETADGGTLFLDEIGDLPLTTQIKLLRFLQESEFERVGGGGTISVDVRIIAATNRNIGKLIKEEKFREDLFYRLNVVNINIPPLRERKEDIPLLIDYFIKKYVSETNKINPAFSREALDILMKYRYPGNVRELENIVHHSLVLARDDIITSKDLPFVVNKLASENIEEVSYDENLSLPELVENLEKKLVKDALYKSNGNQSQAAKILSISERNLRYRLEKWNLKK